MNNIIRLSICCAVLMGCWIGTFVAWQYDTRKSSRCHDLEIRKLELEIEGKRLDIEIKKMQRNDTN